jgi:hypothetical protein
MFEHPDLENRAVSAHLGHETRQRLLRAADSAARRYPGPVGELLRQELMSWMVFGLHLGNSLIMRVTDDLLSEESAAAIAETPAEATQRNSAADPSATAAAAAERR